MRFHSFRVWVNGKEQEQPYVLSEVQIQASGRIPGNINDMVGIEKILTESIKQRTGQADVVVEYFGMVKE